MTIEPKALNAMKVSILIPTFNRADYLAQAVESCLQQDYPDLEIIVSDNASTDRTQSMISKYSSDSRFKYFRNPANIGIRDNWIRLLYELASGGYCKLLADDDYLINPHHISQAMKLTVKHQLDIVYSAEVVRTERAGPGPARFTMVSYDLPEHIPADWWLNNIARRKKVGIGAILYPNLVSGAVFSRTKAIDLKAFYPKTFGLDYELSLRFAMAGRVGYLKGEQYVARAHEKNDGARAPVAITLTGLDIFDRACEFGLTLGLPRYSMIALKRRGLTWFSRSFLLGKWLDENGISIRSLAGLYNVIGRHDKLAALYSVVSVRMIKQLLKRMLGRQ